MSILAPCTHQTCTRCIDKWTGRSNVSTCPICRTPIQRVFPAAAPGAKKVVNVGANRLDAMALSQGVQQGGSMATLRRPPRSRAADELQAATSARRNPRSVLCLAEDELLDVCVVVEDQTMQQLEQTHAKKERRWLERE